MDLQTPLKEYGLTDKEIAVYLALLPLGTVNLQEIARRVEYPRTTVYNTINYLLKKGLISKTIRKGVTCYTSTAPEKLKDKLDEKKKLIETILPELKELKKTCREGSSVEIYEGFKGIYTVILDVFKVKQQTYYFGSYKDALEVIRHLPSHAQMMRIERNIPAKIVINPTQAEIFKNKKYQRMTEMRFTEALQNFPAMIFIYGNKVAMHTVKGDLVGVIISNKEFSQAMKMVFNVYWSIAK